MSLYARLAAAAVVLVLLAALSWRVQLAFERAEQRGYDRRAAEDKAAAEAQTARMRDLQRQAELRYTVAAETRERFIVQTVKEIRDASAPLAACPVPEPVRVRLNAAARCASGDSAAADCGADAVPGSR